MRLNRHFIPVWLPAALVSLAPGGVAWGGVDSAEAAGPYSGHRVVRVSPRTPAELLRVSALTDDFWTCEGPSLREPFDIRVSPEQLDALRRMGIGHEVVIEDVQKYVDDHMAEVLRLRGGDAQSFYDTYRDR
ncbi:MAG: hypothetical protein FJ255_12885, partial [Phycisphaerae bacterium]|nr:hypothetical protein [Phycisphaerae bacterium]